MKLIYLFVVKNMDMGDDFVTWKMLLECHESYIINGDNLTKYFKLKKSASQGDPVFCIPIYVMS